MTAIALAAAGGAFAGSFAGVVWYLKAATRAFMNRLDGDSNIGKIQITVVTRNA